MVALGEELHGDARGGLIPPPRIFYDSGPHRVPPPLTGGTRHGCPCAAALARGFFGVRPGSQIAPASMRRGGLLAARAALVAVARVVVGRLAWVPPAAGRVPALALASPLGGARSAVLVVALSGGAPPGRGGVLLAPLRPWASATPWPWCLRQLLPLPPGPLPPAGGRGKAWDNGKEDSYERNPGGVSFV